LHSSSAWPSTGNRIGDIAVTLIGAASAEARACNRPEASIWLVAEFTRLRN
jgi:hypothetical protein